MKPPASRAKIRGLQGPTAFTSNPSMNRIGEPATNVNNPANEKRPGPGVPEPRVPQDRAYSARIGPGLSEMPASGPRAGSREYQPQGCRRPRGREEQGSPAELITQVPTVGASRETAMNRNNRLSTRGLVAWEEVPNHRHRRDLATLRPTPATSRRPTYTSGANAPERGR